MTYDDAVDEWLQDTAREASREVSELDMDDERDVSFLNSQDEEQEDPPCCPPGRYNKWNPATWCGCQNR